MDELNFTPSNAHFWGRCNGQPKMVQGKPRRPQSDSAKEGEAIHWVAAQCLQGDGQMTDNFVNSDAPPNGVLITQDMADCAFAFVDSCIGYVEHGLQIETEIKGGFGGRADAHHWDDNCRTLRLWDWKSGYGIVDIFENFQFVAMLAGILEDMRNIMGPGTVTIECTVVQPRPHHPDGKIRSWNTTRDDVMPLIKFLFSQKDWGSGDHCTLGAGSHCMKCPAAGDCIALGTSVNDIMSWSTDFGSYELEGQELKNAYDMLKRANKIIDARLIGVNEKIHHDVTTGKPVPGFYLENDFTDLAWDRPINEVENIMSLLGYDVKVPKIKTPTQAIGQLKVPEEVVKKLASRKSKGLKVKPLTGNEFKNLLKQYGVTNV